MLLKENRISNNTCTTKMTIFKMLYVIVRPHYLILNSDPLQKTGGRVKEKCQQVYVREALFSLRKIQILEISDP